MSALFCFQEHSMILSPQVSVLYYSCFMCTAVYLEKQCCVCFADSALLLLKQLTYCSKEQLGILQTLLLPEWDTHHICLKSQWFTSKHEILVERGTEIWSKVSYQEKQRKTMNHRLSVLPVELVSGQLKIVALMLCSPPFCCFL